VGTHEDRHLFVPLVAETVAVLEAESPPLDCILAVAEMKRWVNEVLRGYVADARMAGYGWQEIADALGVTRQAAWQRYQGETRMVSSKPATDYLTADDIWTALASGMHPGHRYELADLYDLVLSRRSLSDADLEPDARGSSSPRWQRNVRNVLQRRKTTGYLDWDGRGGYWLAP
jgi:hypothetical protein